jgi:hypothetical protein
MFADITTGKVIYDLSIALLTGIITGIMTGIFVDYLIRRREKANLKSIRSLMYVDLANAVRNVLLTSNFGASALYDDTSNFCKFSNGAIASIVELKDNDVFKDGSVAQTNFKQRVSERLRTLPPPKKETHESDKLRLANHELRDVISRYGYVIDKESELATIIYTLYSDLTRLISFVAAVDAWDDTYKRESYANRLLGVFRVTEELRSKLYSYSTAL